MYIFREREREILAQNKNLLGRVVLSYPVRQPAFGGIIHIRFARLIRFWSSQKSYRRRVEYITGGLYDDKGDIKSDRFSTDGRKPRDNNETSPSCVFKATEIKIISVDKIGPLLW